MCASKNISQSGGSEITARYFSKYFVKVIIDYFDRTGLNKIPIDNEKSMDIYNNATDCNNTHWIIKDIIHKFPTIEIAECRCRSSTTSSRARARIRHYFYHIKNRLNIRHFYRNPIISSFKPIIYIRETNNIVDRLGFLNIPHIKKLSSNNKSNLNISRKEINDFLKQRIKNNQNNNKCVDKYTGAIYDNMNNIDCIISGKSWQSWQI